MALLEQEKDYKQKLTKYERLILKKVENIFKVNKIFSSNNWKSDTTIEMHIQSLISILAEVANHLDTSINQEDFRKSYYNILHKLLGENPQLFPVATPVVEAIEKHIIKDTPNEAKVEEIKENIDKVLKRVLTEIANKELLKENYRLIFQEVNTIFSRENLKSDTSIEMHIESLISVVAELANHSKTSITEKEFKRHSDILQELLLENPLLVPVATEVAAAIEKHIIKDTSDKEVAPQTSEKHIIKDTSDKEVAPQTSEKHIIKDTPDEEVAPQTSEKHIIKDTPDKGRAALIRENTSKVVEKIESLIKRKASKYNEQLKERSHLILKEVNTIFSRENLEMKPNIQEEIKELIFRNHVLGFDAVTLAINSLSLDGVIKEYPRMFQKLLEENPQLLPVAIELAQTIEKHFIKDTLDDKEIAPQTSEKHLVKDTPDDKEVARQTSEKHLIKDTPDKEVARQTSEKHLIKDTPDKEVAKLIRKNTSQIVGKIESLIKRKVKEYHEQLEEKSSLILKEVNTIFSKKNLKMEKDIKEIEKDIKQLISFNSFFVSSVVDLPTKERSRSEAMEKYYDKFQKLLENYQELIPVATEVAAAIEKHIIKDTPDKVRAELSREITDRVLGYHGMPFPSDHNKAQNIYQNNSLFHEIETIVKSDDPEDKLWGVFGPKVKDAIINTKIMHNHQIPDDLLGPKTRDCLGVLESLEGQKKGEKDQEEPTLNDETIIEIANSFAKIAEGMPEARCTQFKKEIDDFLISRGIDRENWEMIQKNNNKIDGIIRDLEKAIYAEETGKLIDQSKVAEIKKQMGAIKQSLKHTVLPAPSTEDDSLDSIVGKVWHSNIRGSNKEKEWRKGLEDLQTWCKTEHQNNPEWKKVIDVIGRALQYIETYLLYSATGKEKGEFNEKYKKAKDIFEQSIEILNSTPHMHHTLENIAKTVEKHLSDGPLRNNSILPKRQDNKQGLHQRS